MNAKKKTPAGRGSGLGSTGKNRPQNIQKTTSRQRLKEIIVLLAVRGFLPIAWAERFIAWGGLRHD